MKKHPYLQYLFLIVLSTHFISCKETTNYQYIVNLPQHFQGAPVVFMLHGYGSSAENFKADTHFEQEANARGYAVIYLSSTDAGWSAGAGADKNDDVKAICALAKSIQKEFHFDKKRMYVAGFSNGGFMTHRLVVEGKGTFAGGICVAGDMSKTVWKSRKSKTKVSFFQISGEKDNAVPKISNGTAKYAYDPAIEDVMEYYATSNRLNFDAPEVQKIGYGSTLTKYTGDKSKNQVWHLLVKDGHHAWPSVTFNNIETNNLILDFLDTQK